MAKATGERQGSNCVNCGKELLADNGIEGHGSGLVLKSRLVFLNNDGQVLARCKNCKGLSPVPLTFVKSSGRISELQKKQDV